MNNIDTPYTNQITGTLEPVDVNTNLIMATWDNETHFAITQTFLVERHSRRIFRLSNGPCLSITMVAKDALASICFSLHAACLLDDVIVLHFDAKRLHKLSSSSVTYGTNGNTIPRNEPAASRRPDHQTLSSPVQSF